MDEGIDMGDFKLQVRPLTIEEATEKISGKLMQQNPRRMVGYMWEVAEATCSNMIASDGWTIMDGGKVCGKFLPIILGGG